MLRIADPESDRYSPEVGTTLVRAAAGDADAVPALKRVFDSHPELAAQLGDLAAHSRLALLNLATGSNLTAREAIERHANELRERLMDDAPTELERLLVERTVICWLWVHHADLDLTAKLMAGTGDSPGTRAALRRLDQADRRLRASVLTLSTVRRLLRPAATPPDLAVRSGRQIAMIPNGHGLAVAN